LPVPDGFLIDTDAYREFVAENSLQEAILEAVAAVLADQPATLETASRNIANLFERASMSREISEAIERAYMALAIGPGRSGTRRQQPMVDAHEDTSRMSSRTAPAEPPSAEGE
jgi:phosphoenolpyruvate synthase/pyruvate phosphate dikinase